MKSKLLLAANGVFFTTLCLGQGSKLLFEDPFDVGGGGASLTRAAQESALVSNPAQLPYGDGLFRWVGTKTTLMPGKESVELGQTLAGGEDVLGDQQQLISTLEKHPIHLGAGQNVSLVTAYGGFGVYSRVEPDLRFFRSTGVDLGAGTPLIVLRQESYGGAFGSLATRTPLSFLSLSATAKYLMVNQSITQIDLIDKEAIASAKDKLQLAVSPGSLGSGLGFNVGSLLFFQGGNLDLRIAATVDDVGNTALSNSQNPRLQTINAGTSLTLHTEADAFHLALDYRDVLGAYEEPLYQKLYVGAKLMIRSYIGVSLGLYQLAPSIGAEVDLILARVAVAMYTKEYSKGPQVDSRTVYMLSIYLGGSLGF